MDWADVLSKIIVGAFSGLVVAFFTATYALNRFYREKWWERRADLYIQLVESIYIIKKAANYWHDEQIAIHSGYDEHFESLSKEGKESLIKEQEQANIALRKVSDLAPLLLSEKCKILIEKYFETESNLLMKWRYDVIELEEAHHESLMSAEKLLNSIIAEARRELRSDNKTLLERLKNSYNFCSLMINNYMKKHNL